MRYTFHIYRIFALLVALNYFAFRVELCEREFEANHSEYIDDVAFARTTLTWETYDKDNAPQAFVFNAEITLQIVSYAQQQFDIESPFVVPCQPVRDKSPPFAL